MKALALGAKAVLVGRPVIYGFGVAGTEGARHVLAGLLADVDQSMGLVCTLSIPTLPLSFTDFCLGWSAKSVRAEPQHAEEDQLRRVMSRNFLG
jgi:hypothetical protein